MDASGGDGTIEVLDSAGPGPDSDSLSLDSEAPAGDTTPLVDGAPVIEPVTGLIGSPCALDTECLNDAICLDWKGGYCTQPNCLLDSDCPDSAVCAEVQAGTTACLSACAPETPCRAGYGCKPFTSDGATRSACVGLDAEPAPVGGACKATTGCEGPYACLGVVEEGYCALVGCGVAAPCPAEAACVLYNGAATCLRRCETRDECLVGGALERECGPLVADGGTVTDVCLPATAGVGVGSQCALDLECDSGTCRIVAEGKCVGSETGCFSDADCPGGAVCEIAPAYKKGVCTLACGEDVSCPGQSACVAAGTGAYCQLPCKGLADETSCDDTVGERCLFGDPVASTASGGKYVCAVTKVGDAGETCANETECKGAACLGTCAPLCPDTGCPFPTACVEVGGNLRCLRRCFSAKDCPVGSSCTTTATSAAKICVAPG